MNSDASFNLRLTLHNGITIVVEFFGTANGCIPSMGAVSEMKFDRFPRERAAWNTATGVRGDTGPYKALGGRPITHREEGSKDVSNLSARQDFVRGRNWSATDCWRRSCGRSESTDGPIQYVMQSQTSREVNTPTLVKYIARQALYFTKSFFERRGLAAPTRPVSI